MAVSVLVIQNVIKNFLKDCHRRLKHDVAELRAPKDTLLHLIQLDVLEPKYLLRIVVSNGRTLHLADFHLAVV